jgi:hypothetical protein
MKIDGREGHMATTEVIEAWQRQDPRLAEPMMRWAVESEVMSALLDLGDDRIAATDDAEFAEPGSGRGRRPARSDERRDSRGCTPSSNSGSTGP